MREDSLSDTSLVDNLYVVLRLTYLGARFRIPLDIARRSICYRVASRRKKLKGVHQGIRGYRLTASLALGDQSFLAFE